MPPGPPVKGAAARGGHGTQDEQEGHGGLRLFDLDNTLYGGHSRRESAPSALFWTMHSPSFCAQRVVSSSGYTLTHTCTHGSDFIHQPYVCVRPTIV